MSGMTASELFVEAFRCMQKAVHAIQEEKGFSETDHQINELALYVSGTRFEALIPEIKLARQSQKLMLIVSELSEALESLRKGNSSDSHIPQFSGMEAECADAIIRIMNLATDTNSHLAEAIVAKTTYNAQRPMKHGGKKF